MFFFIKTIDVLLKNQYNNIKERVINSVVECLPYKQKVTGSNPVLPSEIFRLDSTKNTLIKVILLKYLY